MVRSDSRMMPLKRMQLAWKSLKVESAPSPPLFGDHEVHFQDPLVLVCAAAFAAAFGASEHPDLDRAADRRAVAAPVGEHLLAALHSEGIEALAAQLQ